MFLGQVLILQIVRTPEQTEIALLPIDLSFCEGTLPVQHTNSQVYCDQSQESISEVQPFREC